MATAEELLGAISNDADEILVVDLNTRIISIPATLTVLGVESDDDVKRLQFKVPRYCGEFDLSTFSIQINFENARGRGDVYPVDDIKITDDNSYVTFSWLVDRTAFASAGNVKFSICMKVLDGLGAVVKEFNTTFATLPVLKGLETQEAVVENNPSAFDVVLQRLYAVEAATGNSTNGYYTVVSINETEEGIEINLSGSDGVHVATVRHGQDGHDPIKGVDYWTEADKNEIQAETKSYIDTKAPNGTTAILTADEWNTDLTQTVTVSGADTDNMVIVAPELDYTNQELYSETGIQCIDQGVDWLKFSCKSLPETDIHVNVAIFNHKAAAK